MANRIVLRTAMVLNNFVETMHIVFVQQILLNWIKMYTVVVDFSYSFDVSLIVIVSQHWYNGDQRFT